MSSLSLDPREVTRNEPRMYPAAGFLSLPSVGMRLAPEILILELFREVFHAENRNEKTYTRELSPDMRSDKNELIFSNAERAVVSAFRGRRKQSRQSKAQPFYAPAYPALAAHAWMAKNRERIIAQLLFNGAIAQHLWGVGAKDRERQRAFVKVIASALAGTRKRPENHDEAHHDILAACLPAATRDADLVAASAALETLTGEASKTVFKTNKQDELAARIFEDFKVLCESEARLPRMLWLRLMMTYLRFALPMWLLAQMRITVLVHSWMRDALEGKVLPDDHAIERALAGRNRGLLRPTLIPTGEVTGRIREYIRCRVELNLMLYAVAKLRPAEFNSSKSIVMGNGNSTDIKLSEVLLIARKASEALRAEPECLQAGSAATCVARNAERYAAWRDPLTNGQGKNIDEFLRVLYRSDQGDEAGGHLLVRQGRGDSAGFRVFPGQLMLQMIAMLAARTKPNGAGRLVLKDIEDHFEEYGVNFSLAAEARPLLTTELQSLGLLAGSPDAGSSVAVTAPF